MKAKRKAKKSGKFKQLVVLAGIAALGAYFYTNIFQSKNDKFNVAGRSVFESASSSKDNTVDSKGHSEDFWTGNKFKW